MADPPDYRELAAAQGKFVVFLASLLQRADVARMEDFASLLATFAETVEETEPGEGALLKSWASAVRAAGSH